MLCKACKHTFLFTIYSLSVALFILSQICFCSKKLVTVNRKVERREKTREVSDAGFLPFTTYVALLFSKNINAVTDSELILICICLLEKSISSCPARKCYWERITSETQERNSEFYCDKMIIYISFLTITGLSPSFNSPFRLPIYTAG